MDYLEFYNLRNEPFSNAPVSKLYFNSAQHSRALVRLMYAADTMKGLAVLVGELGTGKTTLARRMFNDLPDAEYESALLVIIHSGITTEWLLDRIARQLGVDDPAPEKLRLLNQLYTRLVEIHDAGKKAVVLIDEAQMLQSRQLMEEFRGLLNLEVPESKLITFVFFGLPEIEENLQLDEALAQRVALKYRLQAFGEEDTRAYIQHRLRLCGTTKELFTGDALQMIHYYAHGVPRLINTICDNALFEGFLLKKEEIDRDLIVNSAENLGLVSLAKSGKQPVSAASNQPASPIRLPVPGQSPAAPAPGAAEPDSEIDEALAGFGDEPPPPPSPAKVEDDIDNALEGLDEL